VIAHAARVQLPWRAHNTTLIDAGLIGHPIKTPWSNDRPLHIEIVRAAPLSAPSGRDREAGASQLVI